jgi:membrane-associated phospholipid phosphatase
MILKNRYLTASLIILSLFIVLAAVVSPRVNPKGSSITGDDSSAYSQINDSHYKPLNQMMLLLSQYGREVVWTVTAILVFILGGWTGKKTAVVMAITMIVLTPIGAIAKEVVGRPRPTIPQSDFLIAADSEFAFPSGHAVIVSSGSAIFIALFRDSYKKLAISIALTAEAALVCFSRVYVGGHYPLDVAGGILLGVGVALIFIAVTKHIEQVLEPIAKILKK